MLFEQHELGVINPKRVVIISLDFIMDDQFGTIKVADGLYIGDEFSSHDIDTIVMNHITHIINLNSKQVTNKFESHGVLYLNFTFTDDTYSNKATIDREREKEKEKQKEIVLDSMDKNISRVIEVIEEAREHGESVLIHGCRGYTIGVVMYCAYLMLKYKWGLYKTIEFLESRVSKMDVNNMLIRQLRAYQSRISERLIQPLSTSWEVYPGMPLDELTLRNTYMNSFLKGDNYQRMGITGRAHNSHQARITWKEGNTVGKGLGVTTRKTPLKGILKTEEKMSQNRIKSKDKKPEVEPRKSLTNNRNPPQRKFIERQEDRKYRIPNRDQNTPKTSNFSESPLYKRKREDESNQKMLSSKNRGQNQGSAQGFTTLFKHTPIQAQQILNKSLGNFVSDRPPLNIRFDTDNSQEKERERGINRDGSRDKQRLKEKESYQKQTSKQSIKDEVARKLLKKMILEKGTSIAQLQNKENYNNSSKRKDVLARPKCQSEAILQKPKRPLQSERVSEDRKERESSLKRTMINNFMKQKSSQSRPESPVIKNIQQELQAKMDVQKIRNSFQAKTQTRGQSPAASQNRISLKDASTLLNSIFPQHGFRPKWKF